MHACVATVLCFGWLILLLLCKQTLASFNSCTLLLALVNRVYVREGIPHVPTSTHASVMMHFTM